MFASPVSSPQHNVYFELPRGRNQLRSTLTLFAHQQREELIAKEEQSIRLETAKQENMQEQQKTRVEKKKQVQTICDEFGSGFLKACKDDDFITAVDEWFALRRDLKAFHANDDGPAEDVDRSINLAVRKAVRHAFVELAQHSSG